MKNKTVWANRLKGKTSLSFQKIGSSIGVDKRLYEQDIAASTIHAKMLVKQKIISSKDGSKIINGLKKIKLHHKYLNNLNYYKTIKILNNEKFIDGKFFLMSESKSFTPPISEIYYEFYENEKELIEYLKTKSENLQCIVSNSISENHVNFGDTQNPKLSDYADNIDTIKFLLTN